MVKIILTAVVIVAVFIWFCYSLWHDGYNDGVMEERRKRMRSIATYNMHISAFGTELRLLQEELDNIKKNVPCANPERFEDQDISASVLNDELETLMAIEEVENG